MPPSDTSAPPRLADPAACAPAPFGLRALAVLLDVLLAGVITMIILTRVVLPHYVPNWQEIMQRQMQLWEAGNLPDPFADNDFMDLFVTEMKTTFGVLLAYFAISELAWSGTTLGKRVFGLRAARWPLGERPNWVEVIARSVFKSASLLDPRLLLVNLAPVFFSRTRRTVHDYIARTIVTGDAPPPPDDAADKTDE